MTSSNHLTHAQAEVLRRVADHLIPAAHGMPSAGEVVDESRLAFVLAARPDLADDIHAALQPDLGHDPARRLDRLADDDPNVLASLQLIVVGGYYTDAGVRDQIGYPGQVAKPVAAHAYPEYAEEGLLDRVLASGPRWRDPDAAPNVGEGD